METIPGLLTRDWSRIDRRLKLSPRETQILLRIMADEKDHEIAEQLHITRNTLRTYIDRIFRKLDVGSRTGIVVRVFREYVDLTRCEEEKP